MDPATALSWRERLAQGRATLQREYDASGNCTALLERHRRLLDDLLKSMWKGLSMPSALALVGVGGYGRGELYPYSDVDVVVLLPRDGADEHLSSVEIFISTLWDTGIEVGHSVRSVAQCIEEALLNVTVQTNLLEARRVAGNTGLYRKLSSVMRAGLDRHAFCQAKVIEQRQRHNRHHDTAYNLEPNLKESPGGLRDLQNVRWISGALATGSSWSGMVTAGILTAREMRQIQRHERFLKNLRIRLHYVAQRREDRLLFDYQDALAHQLRLDDKPHRRASEQLMQRYYRTVKFIRTLNEILLQELQQRVTPASGKAALPIDAYFQARDGMLELRDETLFERQPSTLLECFLTWQRHPELEGIASGTLRTLWHATACIDTRFRNDPHNRGLFMAILREPHRTARVLRRMNQYGVLGRYLSSFGRIVGQMQYDLFHVYTVDEHTLFVVRNLRRFALPEYAHEYPLCSHLMGTFDAPEVLYIAALFHDIAKGRGGDHSQLGAGEARRFCRTHDLDEAHTGLVSWLVENHLVMSATAQKQDLGDDAVIARFATKVADGRRLTALYLLTVADIRGTSPKVWNAWKGKLLQELYFATQRYLSGAGFTLDALPHTRRSEALRLLRAEALPSSIHEQLWSQLEEDYFVRHDAQEIAWHVRELHAHVGTAQPIVRARLAAAGEGVQVMIYTPDREDVFACISGGFEQMNFNIMQAKVQTTRHGYALDSLLVLDASNRGAQYRDLLSYIEFELMRRLTQGASTPVQKRISRHLRHFPIAPQISISPDEKGVYHMLSVTAGDRPGLLSRVAQVFIKHGVRLHTARITTLGERAEDTFLVTATDDRLNDQRALMNFEKDLLEQLR
ncbi:MAG: [protein-PII] uridylyltransferase [Burkholderiales bacterium]